MTIVAAMPAAIPVTMPRKMEGLFLRIRVSVEFDANFHEVVE
jgi:hypothetical protein